MVVKLKNVPVPRLENGDHLTRDEFERRYDAMPENIKAELIEGVVYMASPTRYVHHSKQQFQIVGWLSHYQVSTPGTDGSDNGTVRLDLDNEPQPDVVLFIDPTKGGQSEIDEEGYITLGPELVVEVAASSASIDLKKKLPVYRRNSVREYIVWRVYDAAIDWFVLRNGDYERIAEDEAGIRKSEVFPGLWLDSAALLRGDMVDVFAVVQKGLATKEHAEFVARLRT